jgi:hypothetical protein
VRRQRLPKAWSLSIAEMLHSAHSALLAVMPSHSRRAAVQTQRADADGISVFLNIGVFVFVSIGICIVIFVTVDIYLCIDIERARVARPRMGADDYLPPGRNVLAHVRR